MTERKIFAVISVDDDEAIKNVLGTGEYLEKEFGWLQQSGISLDKWLLAEKDSTSDWERYIEYLIRWAFEYSGDDDNFESPDSFNVWRSRR